MSEPVIEAAGLVKSFGATRALDGLDLVVQPGEVHGFLGPNGAGKSTTIRALLGQLRLQDGTARVLGMDPWDDAVAIHRRLAYVPGDVTLWPNLSGGEVIDLLIRLRGQDPTEGSRAKLLDRFALDPTKKGRAYSKGNRQKVALVAALAGAADLLVLDEPTSGLDPLMEEVFRDCVREAVGRGTSVLLSSHILAEVEHLCDRVTIIREGRTVESGSLADMRHLARTRVSAVLEHDPDRDALARVPGLHDLVVADHTVTCTADSVGLTGLTAELARAGISSLTTTPPSLEELFRDVYRQPEP